MLATGGIISYDNGWTTHTFLGSAGVFTSGFDGEVEINTFTEKVNRTFKRWVMKGEHVSIAPVSDLTFFGNAGYSTAQKKFGNGSYYFDGSGDYLTVANVGTNFAGDYTIEAWVYLTAYKAAYHVLLDTLALNGNGSRLNSLIFYISSAGQLRLFESGADRIAGGTVLLNVWTHVLLAKSGSTVTAYIDGSSVGSTTYAQNLSDNNCNIGVGANSPADTNGHFLGYIDEYRISDIARCTANFSPSLRPHTHDANTKLLLHCEQGVFSVRYPTIQPRIFAIPTFNSGFQFRGGL